LTVGGTAGARQGGGKRLQSGEVPPSCPGLVVDRHVRKNEMAGPCSQARPASADGPRGLACSRPSRRPGGHERRGGAGIAVVPANGSRGAAPAPRQSSSARARGQRTDIARVPSHGGQSGEAKPADCRPGERATAPGCRAGPARARRGLGASAAVMLTSAKGYFERLVRIGVGRTRRAPTRSITAMSDQ